MSISYCTLAKAQSTQGVDTSLGSPKFNAYFNAIYPQVTARIDQYRGTYKWFAPVKQTRTYNAGQPDLVDDVLLFDFPCLSVDSIVVNSNTFAAAQYTITRSNDSGLVTEIYSRNWPSVSYPYQAISVTGLWGYRQFYDDRGWDASVTTLNGDIDDSTTTVNVTSATALSVGMLVRVDSEYMSIDAINVNALTVSRGIRGTTAASHNNGDALDVFVPQPDIQDAAAMMIAYGFERQGNFQQVQFDGASGVALQFPPDLPLSVVNILNRYTFGYVGVA